MARFAPATVEIKVKVKLSLWSSIKMRIAGIHIMNRKMTLQEYMEWKNGNI